MTDDLVKFLRDQSLYRPGQEGDEREWCRKMNAAADEIERLRLKVADYEAAYGGEAVTKS